MSLPNDTGYTLTFQGESAGVLEKEFTEGDEVTFTVKDPDDREDWFPWEARDKDGKLFVADESKTMETGKYSYGNLNYRDITGSTEQDITFKMPYFDVDVTFLDQSYLGYFYLENDSTVDQMEDFLNDDEGKKIILPGATSDTFTFDSSFDMGPLASGITLVFDKDVTINIDAPFTLQSNYIYNNGVVNLSSELELGDGGSFYNDNELNINPSGSIYIPTGDLTNTGTLNNEGSIRISEGYAESYGTIVNKGSMTVSGSFTNMIVENPDNPGGATFDNYGVLTINAAGSFENWGSDAVLIAVFNNYSGASVDNIGTFNNTGTFNNYAGATITNRGTINNISDHTFNNYGTVIQEDTGVLNNGDGAGRNGVTNNFADGVFLNSGTMVNNDGSTFRNYGTIIEETPDAVSPDLAPGSKPIVHYGENPETVLTGIPEGAVGGACGDTLFWYFEELEEEEAEKLRRFTEGHTASASDAERAEDDASVSYILHITGSGAMDNFDLDGGNSTAPWFEELDGAVRAVKIDEGVTQIGKNAFYGIRTLAYVSFAGTDTEWKSVKVQSGNEALDKTVLLFGGGDDLVLGDPLVADDEEVSWTEPEAKPAAAAAGKATASDAEKEEPEEGKKEQGDTEQKPETPETPWAAEPESRKPEETESGKSGNGKQDSEA